MRLSFTKYIQFLIVFVLLTQFSLLGYSQTTRWFTLSNASGLTKVVDIAVDAENNTYAWGEYQQEVEFNSASNVPSQLAYFSIQSCFLTKHDSLGVLQFVAHIQSISGSSSIPYAEKVMVLKDGRIAVSLYSHYSFRIVDAQKDTTEFNNQRGMTILLFDVKGTFIKKVDTQLNHCKAWQEGFAGSIYMVGEERYHNQSGFPIVARVDVNSGSFQQIWKPTPEATFRQGLSDVIVTDSKVWVLLNQSSTDQFRRTTEAYHVYSFDIGGSNPTFFKKFEMGEGNSTRASLFVSNGTPFLSLIVGRLNNIPLTLNGTSYETERRFHRLFVINLKDRSQKTATFRGAGYNMDVIGSNEGFILQTPAIDSLIYNDAVLAIDTSHAQHFHELYHIFLDGDLKFKGFVNGGGTAHNYHISTSTVAGNTLVVGSDLLDFGNFDFGRRELSWRFGYYLRSIALPPDY